MKVKKIILWILLICWSITIFSFSAQPATESDNVSKGFSAKVLTFIAEFNIIDIPAFKSERGIADLADKINHYVRKLAHFTIYFVLALICYFLASCYFERKKAILITLLYALIFAIGDEFHQTFVPGRAGRFKDVMIDFSGAFLSCIIIYICGKIKNKKTEKSRLK